MSSSSRGRNTERFNNPPWLLARKHQSQELGWACLHPELSARCACAATPHVLWGCQPVRGAGSGAGFTTSGSSPGEWRAGGLCWLVPVPTGLASPPFIGSSLPCLTFPQCSWGAGGFFPWRPCLRSASEGTRPETPQQATCSAGRSHVSFTPQRPLPSRLPELACWGSVPRGYRL